MTNEEIEDFITFAEKCNCGRSHCYVFCGGIGERGLSLSKSELEDILNNLPRLKKKIEELLN